LPLPLQLINASKTNINFDLQLHAIHAALAWRASWAPASVHQPLSKPMPQYTVQGLQWQACVRIQVQRVDGRPSLHRPVPTPGFLWTVVMMGHSS